jgi:hypothetical protein
LTAAKQAKLYGAKSLLSLSESVGYNIDTLRRMHRDRPDRFRVLCLGALCVELNVDALQLRELHGIVSQIKGG